MVNNTKIKSNGSAWKCLAFLLIGLIIGWGVGFYIGSTDLITIGNGDDANTEVEKTDKNDRNDEANNDNDNNAQAVVEEPEPAELDISNSPFMGDDDAAITIVDFSDYQCPYCARLSTDIVAQLKTNYIDIGKVKYVFKDFPLNFHHQALAAAMAARCAGDQDNFWEMHDVIFENQKDWSGQNLAEEIFAGYAEDLGLNTTSFDSCMEEQKYAKEIEKDKNEGMLNGVKGTPTLFVNGQIMRGLPATYEGFAAFLDTQLEE